MPPEILLAGASLEPAVPLELLALLRQAFTERKLKFFGRLADLAQPARFAAWLREVRTKDWVVSAKPPFGGPREVLKYLARYTHRVAISNSRLQSLDQRQVTCRWRDSRHADRTKWMTLEAVEFIRRFLLHILPPRFVKFDISVFWPIATAPLHLTCVAST